MTVTDWIQAISSVFGFLAAVAAVIIASKAPRAAAKFADDFRRQSSEAEDKHRLQMNIFLGLAKCRRELLNVDARAAVNLVDLAFSDNAQVKEARKLFIAATESDTSNAVMIVERYHALLEAVCRAMGFGDALSATDLRTGWYPQAMSTLDAAQFAEAEEKLARRALKDAISNASATPPVVRE